MLDTILCQLNPTTGDFKNNYEQILTHVDKAPEESLLILSGTPLSGTNVGELAKNKDFFQENQFYLTQLIKEASAKNVDIIMETLSNAHSSVPEGNHEIIYIDGERNPQNDSFGTQQNKNVLTIYRNRTTYSILSTNGFWETSSHIEDEIKNKKTDVVVVLDESPYRSLLESVPGFIEPIYGVSKREIVPYDIFRERLKRAYSLQSSTGTKTLIYMNPVGGQDEQVYDGRSFIRDKDTGVLYTMKQFEEEKYTLSTGSLHHSEDGLAKKIVNTLFSADPLPRLNSGEIYKSLVMGTRDYLKKNGAQSVVLGVSGGIDSALLATIASDAIGGENVYGVSMPSEYSSEGSVTDAEELMSRLGGSYRQIPIGDMFTAFTKNMTLEGVAKENLQARIRGTILMGISNQEGHFVLAPGNKSELAMGYSTIYGDAVGGYAPLKDIYKTTVFSLAEWRNGQGKDVYGDSPIPVSSITKPPSAELSPGQLDEDSLPDYSVLDDFLQKKIELQYSYEELVEGFGEELVSELNKNIKQSEWKRKQYPMGTKISLHGFDSARNIPVAHKGEW